MSGEPTALEPLTLTIPEAPPPAPEEGAPEVVKAPEAAPPKVEAKGNQPDPRVVEDLKRQLAGAQERVQQVEQFAHQQAGEVTKYRSESEQRAHEALVNGIDAAKANVTQAKQALRTARDAGDMDAETTALESLQVWKYRETQLEDARAEWEEARKAPPPKPAAPPPPADPVAAYTQQMAPESAAWVRAHPEYVTDRGKNKMLVAAHELALGRGMQVNSSGYLADIEKTLGIGDAPAPAKPEALQAPPERERQVAAPVTRGVPAPGSINGQAVTLTPEERAMARSLDMSDEDYARGKIAAARDPRYSN